MAKGTKTRDDIHVVGTLPTNYSPPAACTAITSNEVVGIDFASTCLPKNFDPAPTAYYSPGWRCPDGYHAPKSCRRSASSDATVHTVTCCPSRSNVALTCVDNPDTLSSVWSTLFCTWSAGSKETVLLVTSTSTDSSTSTVITSAVTMSGAEGINAYGIRMIWDDKDKPTTGTDADATDAGTVASATATGNSDNGGSSGGSSGLSTGAIAAIAVVIPIVAIIAFAGFFLWFRRRKQRQQQGASELYGSDQPKELPSDTSPNGPYGSQFSREPQELESRNLAVELPAETPNSDETRAASSLGRSSDGVSKMDTTSPSLSTVSPDGGHDRVHS